MSKPDWLDEDKLVQATFAFEGEGRIAYGGPVVDLGDGTCRLAVKPLLGDGSPEFGDRVDLFWNPTDPFTRPWIGYRVYGVDEVVPGRHFAFRREPTQEEIKQHEREVKAQRERELEWLERSMEAIKLRGELGKLTMRYTTLLLAAVEQKIELPEKLAEEKDEDGEENHEAPNGFSHFLDHVAGLHKEPHPECVHKECMRHG